MGRSTSEVDACRARIARTAAAEGEAPDGQAREENRWPEWIGNIRAKVQGRPEEARDRYDSNRLQLIRKVVNDFWPREMTSEVKAQVRAFEMRTSKRFKTICPPIDIGFIKSRLERYYYRDADECIRDIAQFLANMCLFYEPRIVAELLQYDFLKEIGEIPKEEIPVAPPPVENEQESRPLANKRRRKN